MQCPRFDCLFLGCHCVDFSVVPVPLLPGLHLGVDQLVMHEMLDIYLWLPRREGFVVIDPNHCRLHRIVLDTDTHQYFEFILIYLEQVSKALPILSSYSPLAGLYRPLMVD
jgi:hypothetical protein